MSAIAQFQTVELPKLTIDHRYQRPVDKTRVQKMIDQFDPRKIGTLEVAKHNGTMAIFDGQHRYFVLQGMGFPTAPCLVHTDLGPGEEAQLFVDLQMQRKRVSPVERFKAKVFAGDPVAKDIKRIVERYGHRVGPHRIRAVTALERIYRKGGAEGLAETLRLLDIWDGDARQTDGMIIEGLFWFWHAYGDERLNDQAIHRLADTSPTTVLRRATGLTPGGGGWTAAKVVARELLKISKIKGRPRQHN